MCVDLLPSTDIIDEEPMEGYLLDDDTIDDEIEITEEDFFIETFEEEENLTSETDANSSSGILGYFKSAFKKK